MPGAITAAAELGDCDALDRELAAYAALADELRQPRTAGTRGVGRPCGPS